MFENCLVNTYQNNIWKMVAIFLGWQLLRIKYPYWLIFFKMNWNFVFGWLDMFVRSNKLMKWNKIMWWRAYVCNTKTHNIIMIMIDKNNTYTLMIYSEIHFVQFTHTTQDKVFVLISEHVSAVDVSNVHHKSYGSDQLVISWNVITEQIAHKWLQNILVKHIQTVFHFVSFAYATLVLVSELTAYFFVAFYQFTVSTKSIK